MGPGPMVQKGDFELEGRTRMPPEVAPARSWARFSDIAKVTVARGLIVKSKRRAGSVSWVLTSMQQPEPVLGKRAWLYDPNLISAATVMRIKAEPALEAPGSCLPGFRLWLDTT
jgi:hypothetical protein